MVEEGKADLTPRTEIPEQPEKERVRDFREVELVLTEEQARRRPHVVLPVAFVQNAISVCRFAKEKRSITNRPMGWRN